MYQKGYSTHGPRGRVLGSYMSEAAGVVIVLPYFDFVDNSSWQASMDW